MMRGCSTLLHTAPLLVKRSRQQQRDHNDDRRDEDQRLSVRHAPHRALPLCTNSH
jgi:hypothetical protein